MRLKKSNNRLYLLFSNKWFLFLIFTGIIAFLFWRINQISESTNLLANPDFEIDNLSGWKTAGEGRVQVSPDISGDIDNIVLELKISDSRAGSWIGVGQDVTVDPLESYRLVVNYRLTNRNWDNNKAQVILRVSQLDQDKKLITVDQIPDPKPLAVTLNDKGVRQWSSLAYSFTTTEQATTIEVGVGLFGYHTTSIEIDNLVLQTYPTPTILGIVSRDPIILPVSLLLIFTIGGYILYRPFKSRRAGMHVLKNTDRVLNSRYIVVVLINIVVFFVLAELLALIIYFFHHGELFYTSQNKNKYQLIGEIQKEELTGLRVQPYFGFVRMPGAKHPATDGQTIEANNYGFFSDYDYPFVKTHEDMYIIGIFGGSVATQFAVMGGVDYLVEDLKQSDVFRNKEIVILNFANGSYKQPQQLQVLTYFLAIGQEIDMVINIDGFNEVALSSRNNKMYAIDISMPSGDVMMGVVNLVDHTTLTPEKLESLTRINHFRARLNNLAEKTNKNNIASVNFVLEQYYKYILGKYREELVLFQQIKSNASNASLIYLTPTEKIEEERILFETMAEAWTNSSIMMDQILAAREIPYYHFLQPNQYYSKRSFSDEEAKIALSPHSAYRREIEAGYPVFIEKSDILEQYDINFYNGVDILDDESGIVYSDDCCHYNELGYQIMADFIATSILSDLN
jgi:hypothetical protein